MRSLSAVTREPDASQFRLRDNFHIMILMWFTSKLWSSKEHHEDSNAVSLRELCYMLWDTCGRGHEYDLKGLAHSHGVHGMLALFCRWWECPINFISLTLDAYCQIFIYVNPWAAQISTVDLTVLVIWIRRRQYAGVTLAIPVLTVIKASFHHCCHMQFMLMSWSTATTGTIGSRKLNHTSVENVASHEAQQVDLLLIHAGWKTSYR